MWQMRPEKILSLNTDWKIISFSKRSDFELKPKKLNWILFEYRPRFFTSNKN